MPEEHHHKHNRSKEVHCLEELITQTPAPHPSVNLLQHTPHFRPNSPERTPRSPGQPRLKQQRNNSSPVLKRIAHIELLNHVTVVDMPYDEWESVHQSENEERVGDPAVEDL